MGIVGKEGKQASLAADFSVTQFSFLTKLLLWHGRNSYRRSAKLAQFVIHRGLIISVMQAVFSAIFYFAPIALYQGWLMVGYATIYTMAPVFSLVLDMDVSEDLALLYPELYKELTKGRALSYKTFFQWLMISLYQGILLYLLLLVNDTHDGYHRRGHHDHVSRSFRERIPAYRIYLVYSPNSQRTYHGRFGDYYMVCSLRAYTKLTCVDCFNAHTGTHT